MNGPRVVVAGRWLGEGAAAAPGTPGGGPPPQRPGADPALRAPGNGAADPGGGDSPAFEAVVSSQPNPDPGSGDPPATLRALGAVASGIMGARPGAHCSLVPLGPGPVFDEAAAGVGSFTAVRVPTGAPSTAPAGEAVRAALAGGGTVVVEGGHNAAVDCGFGFLTALTGISVHEGDDLARSLPAALDRVASLSHSDLGDELARAVADIRLGAPSVRALTDLAARNDSPALSRLCQTLSTAIGRGSPLAAVLHDQARDIREASRQRLMEEGGKREIAMLFPVVFLILPVTVLFALYPGLMALDITP